MTQATKKWYKSKTFWFNVITISLGFTQVIADVYAVPTEVLALVGGFGNIMLRFLTTHKLDY